MIELNENVLLNEYFINSEVKKKISVYVSAVLQI